MGIIERHAGCLSDTGCFGPIGPYYTVFGTELEFLTKHIIISIILGLIFFGILLFLNKKEKIKLSIYLIIIIPIILAIIIFFLLAYFFPVRVIY